MKKAPSYKNPPSSINPEAVELWKDVLRKFADDIYESKSLTDQWKKAKSHFERTCSKKGISPYSLVSLAKRLRDVTRIL